VLLGKLDWSAIGHDLKNWIARALQSLGSSPQIASARAALRHVDFEALTSDERELLARTLFGGTLAQPTLEERAAAVARLAMLGTDLKAELLSARSSLADG